MKQLSKKIHDINELADILGSYEIRESAKSALSTLIHIYTAVTSEVWLQSISQEIESHYPSAHIIGATTCFVKPAFSLRYASLRENTCPKAIAPFLRFTANA